ncbi:MAG: anthranilate phosphoribosyltransferase [Candidatus Eisenbacteria bacterium]|nr:anthranilate phosphoribosyltransferase [Candidatus Eisenbacteria bacterium]
MPCSRRYVGGGGEPAFRPREEGAVHYQGIAQAIDRVVRQGVGFDAPEMRFAMGEIMEGRATDAQIAAFLVGLHMKGVTVEEILGAASVMRERTRTVRTAHDVVLDTCGTGGDGTGTFNVSTVTAFVTAGAGVCTAKHGGYRVSSRCGSAELLDALGVNIRPAVTEMETALREGRIAFLFAPLLNDAMKHAVGPREEIGVRTLFNLLLPLTNPAGAGRQLLGVYDRSLLEPAAEALQRLGSERAWVVHGADGSDEITLTGTTYVAEMFGGTVKTFTLEPEDFGFEKVSLSEILGGEPEKNASIALSVLHGEPGPARETVIANAAAALLIAGHALTLEEGVDRAMESIDSGAALGRLEYLRSFGRGPADFLSDLSW